MLLSQSDVSTARAEKIKFESGVHAEPHPSPYFLTDALEARRFLGGSFFKHFYFCGQRSLAFFG